ncbi:hypothetical protein BH09VER1_BH09VER1_47250 [soil metagenome]
MESPLRFRGLRESCPHARGGCDIRRKGFPKGEGGRNGIISGRSRAFSLIELLVVMGVISLMVGMGISSMNLWRSQLLSNSGNVITDLVTMARQNSLGKNTSTAIVIKTRNEGAYTSICLMEQSRSDDGTIGAWKMLVPWKTLKDGVVFSPDALNTFLNASSNVPVDFPTQITFRGQSVNAPGDTVVQVYKADGTLSAGQTLRLRLTEGTTDNAHTVTYSRPAAQGAPGNCYDIIFLRDTGQAKVVRL